MFTLGHIIWMVICVVGITISLVLLLKKRPSLEKVLTVCCVICVVSELVKIFDVINIWPNAEGTKYYPYMETNHIPLHLCSIHLFTIFYCRFSKESEFKNKLYGFMFPTCSIGAAFAILLPSILSKTDTVVSIFTNPLCYQTFIYHAMLIVLGVYIFVCKKDEFTKKNYWYAMLFLGLLSVFSLYFNSVFGTATYENGKLVSVEHVTNFFFTYTNPIGLNITEKWQWMTYIGVLTVLAFGLIALFYIPIFIKDKKNKEIETEEVK